MLFRAQAKRRRTDGSKATPTVQEPEKAKPASPAPHAEPTKARKETPADAPQPPEPVGYDMAIESPPEVDPQPPNPSAAEDVVITEMGYQSPSNVLTRHTAKAKANSPEEFGFPVLEKMTADDLHAGYLNRLNTSRNMELKLVGLMKKKYVVLLLSFFPYTLM